MTNSINIGVNTQIELNYVWSYKKEKTDYTLQYWYNIYVFMFCFLYKLLLY